MSDEHENLSNKKVLIAEAPSAVIYEKPRSLIKCEYVWRHTDRWIDFPWSVPPPGIERRDQVRDA